MRYPISALEQKCGTYLTMSDKQDQFAPNQGLANRLGVSRSVVIQARQRGLSVRQADEFACRAGYHPSLVWPSWFEDAEDEAVRTIQALQDKS